MAISIGGLASGVDTSSLIDSLMAVAKQPIDALTTRQQNLNAAAQTISAFSTKLSTLKTAALALTTDTGFASFTASSSDNAVVASATGSSNIGSYEVAVTALAKAQRGRSTTFDSTTTALGMSGSLSIAFGTSDPTKVTIAETDTLSDIAAKISSSGARVSAAVVFDGSKYRLNLQGLDTGAENAFTVTEDGTTLGLDDPQNTYQNAQDAALTVDGLKITSKTNQVASAIPGVTLALTKLTSSTTVQVSSDSTSLQSKIKTLVSAYNDVVTSGHTATGYAGAKAANSELAADSAVRGALNKLGSLITGPVANTSGLYQSLASVGIKSTNDGTLTFDSSKFQTALTSDPASVRRLFVTDTVTGATGIMSSLMSAVDSLVIGTASPITARIATFSSRSKRLDDTKTKMQSHLDDYQEQLKKQFSNMDQLVSKYKSMSSALDASSLNTSSNNSSGSNS